MSQGLNIAFSGLTISGGRFGGQGVGIFSLSDLTLTNVHVTDNQAGLNGGGVHLAFAKTPIPGSARCKTMAAQRRRTL